MKSFFKFAEKNSKKSGKLAIVFLLILMSFSFLVIQPKQVQAQLLTFDSFGAAISTGNNIFQKTANAFKYLWQKGGSMAFQQTLRTVLNKVAVDTANYVGSGGQGQKPLFITNPWQYAENIGDAAAGAYLENFAANLADSSSCDKKKLSCNEACYDGTTSFQGSVSSCLADCQNVCSTGRASTCKKSCDSDYTNAVTQGNIGYSMGDYSFDSNAAIQQRTACFANCDKAAGAGGATGTTNSLATPSFNVCQPSSIDAKLKITLGLANQSRSQGPDCNASDIIKNWGNLDNYGNSVKALKDLYDSTKGGYNDQLFLSDIKGIFDPGGNDLGIYLQAKSDSALKASAEVSKATNVLVGKGGWLDAQLISGDTKSLPNQAEINAKGNYDQYAKSFGTYTGDAFVDALNTFLSQTAFTAFNTLMQNLGKTATQGSTNGNSQDYSNPNSGPSLGEGAVKKESGKLNKPDYGSQTNYDILSQLAICQNKEKPGPTDCVIDNAFMQAIAEKKTVAEAMAENSLKGDWQVTKYNQDDAYTLRNISILRKYRVLPVGWEVAVNLASQQNPPVTSVTLKDLVSCYDPNDDFKSFSPSFNQASNWCVGLVDPNWVLKAPLNSCLKEGIGGQVLGEPTITAGFPALNGQPATLSTYSITRAEGYCADNQTCIKENNNGSCDAYGYCSEEKRTWDFGSDSCSPINNTCKNFSGGTDFKTASYLENTLDYSNCNASSAGCRQYSLNGTYLNKAVTWDASKTAYFNGSELFSSCDQTSEGCTGLIRSKNVVGNNLVAVGTNLVMNSDFREDKVGDTIVRGGALNSWPLYAVAASWTATIVDHQSDPLVDAKSIQLTTNGSAGKSTVGLVSSESNSLVPKNLQIIPGQAYSLSADVLLVSGTAVQANIGYGDNLVASELTTRNVWQRITVTRSPIDSFSKPIFFIGAYSNSGPVTVYIKNIKFEAANISTAYSAYGAAKIYEKLIPNYLEKECYVDPISPIKNYSLKSGAPDICTKTFVRKCNQDEVGCELYKSDANSFSVAAKISSTDLCPAECLNYDVYISRQTTFNSSQRENLIPATAKKCTVNDAGCNEFTNLDAIAQGGEQKEYYTELKQCIKPSTSDCGAYYAWEGTDSGYQLKSYSLKKGLNGGPAVTSDDALACNSITYHSAVSSPSYNSDCLEFYNAAGQITYHLASKTITCSDDCHPYRLTEINIDSSITQASQCVDVAGTDRNWDVQNNNCQVCLSGGTYDPSQKACIYQAIPSEGKTCNAAANGCREYNGNKGENVRLISASDFETSNMWTSNCSNGTSLSSIANTNNGHSLKYNNNASSCQPIGGSGQSSRTPLITQIFASDGVGATLKVGQSVRQGSAYAVNFVARADQNTNIKIYLYNPETKAASYFSGVTVAGGNEWQVYRANLENLDHVVSSNEVIVISGNNDFYFDNFVLNEISQRYYLIKNTSQVKNSCYQDNFGVFQGFEYNLGCRQYSDRAGLKYNLRQFSKLCAESGVGCEQMIDTKNYSPSGAGIWGDTNNNKVCDASETDCVAVSGDTAIFAVYDPKKQCGSSDAGCSRLGQSTKVGGSTFWSDVYKKNNPDNYSSILCGAGSVGCEKWTDDQGASYTFKDPGLNTCVYRGTKGSSVKAWYKSPIKRCDKDGNKTIDGTEKEGGSNSVICLKDSDCGAGVTCMVDNNDYPCHYSTLKTLGLGGAGNQVPVPDQVTGLCEAKESTCTEYIDPVSSFIPNLVYNANYQIMNNAYEGWNGNTQTIKLEANKLYIFEVEGTSVGITSLTFSNDILPLQNTDPTKNNTLGTGVKSLVINAANQPQLFYTGSVNNQTAIVSGPSNTKTIIVRPAIIDYQLQSNLDTSSCNGLVDKDNGCIMFNERSINGAYGLTSLDKTAYKFNASKAPYNCTSGTLGDCNANKLIKVKPNRTCAKWLSCISYVKDDNSITPTCYAVGECDRLTDDNKECANFVASSGNPRSFDVTGDKNASGYALMNKYYFSQMKEVGFNSDFHYDFEDLVPYLSCTQEGTNAQCYFANNSNAAKEYLVREKVKGGADYPAHGKTYLKVPSGKLISPQIPGSGVSLLADKIYYLNFLINTHNSGVGGKIYIKARDRRNTAAKFVTIATSTTLTANNGWERKIIQFKTNNSDSIYRVEMGSDTPGQNGFVYFDDLNIEPVLNTAPDQYISRECRLYPETSSLTCGDSLVRDGLEGYCLEHDLKNPEVCSLWYPVDHINSATTGKPMNGYNGLAPLSYCKQVNGNFDIVEKRKVIHKPFLSENDPLGECYKIDAVPSDGFHLDQTGVVSPDYCTSDYVLFTWAHTYTNDAGHDHCMVDYWCVPKEKDLKVKYMNNTLSLNTTFDLAGQTELPVLTTDTVYSQSWQGEGGISVSSEGWYKYNGITSQEKDNADPAVRVYNYDKGANQEESDLELISGPDPEKNFRLACDSFTQVVDSLGNNKAWSNRVSSDSLYPTTTPLFFLQQTGDWYGGNAGLVEKRVSHLVRKSDSNGNCDGGNSHDGFNYENTSNNIAYGVCESYGYPLDDYVDFYYEYTSGRCYQQYWCVPKLSGAKTTYGTFSATQVGGGSSLLVPASTLIDGIRSTSDGWYLYNGLTVAEANNASPAIRLYDYATKPTTESGLKSISGAGTYMLSRYGRNRQDVPFGAAVLPDNLDLLGSEGGAVKLRDQYSTKQKETAFAGRPYGCSGNGCLNIGSCSLNPDVYCLVDPESLNTTVNLNRETCNNGGYGVCVPLWYKSLSGALANEADYKQILKTLFLKSYTSYSFGTFGYVANIYNYDSEISACNNGIRGADNQLSSYCAIYPKVQNIILKLNGQVVPYVSKRGMYSVEFNTSIDKEQEPLKELQIDWGDGNQQIVTGQDSRPSGSTPHRFYHYYNQTNVNKINIKAIDNWNFYGSDDLNVGS